MSAIEQGLTGVATVLVSSSNTAAALGNAGVDVYATPFMVALMEQACREAVESHLSPGMATVGGLVELRHLAPSPVGFTVTATALLEEVKGAKLVFHVTISDEIEKVGEGKHVRFTVPQEDLETRAAKKAAMRGGKDPGRPGTG